MVHMYTGFSKIAYSHVIILIQSVYKKGWNQYRDVLSDFERREQAYEMLDRHVREHLDMEKIYSFISEITVEKR